MAVLEYATTSRARFQWWQWAVAITAGAFAGYVVSIKPYEVMLQALAGGMQVTIRDVGEPFRHTMTFASVAVVAGVLVALLAMYLCRTSPRNLPGWVVLMIVVFAVGATVGFVYERVVWTPRNGARVAVGLSDVPVFTAPVIGCIAVICFALITVIRRRFAARPAG